MKKALIFDLDDTLLWDAKSVETALRFTCEAVGSDHSNTLYEAIREEAPKLYKSYPFYPFSQQIGINPFEGLWGTFDDGTFDFPAMEQKIAEYQKTAWKNALYKIDSDDEQLALTLAKQFVAFRKENPFVYEETFEVLQEVAKDYKIGLLTNGAPSLQNTKLSLTPELATYVDAIVISGEVGIGKPDTTPFLEMLKKLDCLPNQAVMIGDNLQTDIRGANALEIDSVWINHHGVTPPADVHPTYTIHRLAELLHIL